MYVLGRGWGEERDYCGDCDAVWRELEDLGVDHGSNVCRDTYARVQEIGDDVVRCVVCAWVRTYCVCGGSTPT